MPGQLRGDGEGARVGVRIEIERGSPIQGRLRTGDTAEAEPFFGWLELAEKLELARLALEPEAPSGDRVPPPSGADTDMSAS